MKATLIAGFVFLLGGWLCVLGFNSYEQYTKLDTQGIDVMSEPLEGYTKHTKIGITTGYSLYPKFKMKNGEIHSCAGSIDQDIIDSLQEMPIIKVRYLPSDPSVCQVEGAGVRGVWFLMIIGIFIILGSSAFIYNRSSLPY